MMKNRKNSPFTENQLLTLTTVARNTMIALTNGQPAPVIDGSALKEFSGHSNQVFIGIKFNGQLYGCIGCRSGSLAVNAQKAARSIYYNKDYLRFHQPSPLSSEQLVRATFSISIIHSKKELHFNSEKQLLAQIRLEGKGKNGLTIYFDDNDYNATYIPKVGEQFQSKERYLEALKQKAIKNGHDEKDRKKQSRVFNNKIDYAEKYEALDFSDTPALNKVSQKENSSRHKKNIFFHPCREKRDGLKSNLADRNKMVAKKFVNIKKPPFPPSFWQKKEKYDDQLEQTLKTQSLQTMLSQEQKQLSYLKTVNLYGCFSCSSCSFFRDLYKEIFSSHQQYSNVENNFSPN